MSAKTFAAACVAALALGVGLAAASTRAHVASAAPCTTGHLEVWLGDGEGGGTAGHIYYPLEFSNVGHSSCTLYGFPGLSAWGGPNASRIGLPATRDAGPHTTVTLAPNGTAHAIFAIAEAGAVCPKPVAAAGLTVYPPGQKTAQQVEFPFQACPHASVMFVEPVRAGVGIPGYTGS
jgi:hypothetical protein